MYRAGSPPATPLQPQPYLQLYRQCPHYSICVPRARHSPPCVLSKCLHNQCNPLVQDQAGCCPQEMCSPIGLLGQSIPFVPERCRQPTSLKKGLFPILIRVWYCWPPMTTFTTGFRLLPMSWRASNTFTRTYRGENGALMLGPWTPRLPQGLFFKIAKSVKNHLLRVEREPWGEACRRWIR